MMGEMQPLHRKSFQTEGPSGLASASPQPGLSLKTTPYLLLAANPAPVHCGHRCDCSLTPSSIPLTPSCCLPF